LERKGSGVAAGAGRGGAYTMGVLPAIFSDIYPAGASAGSNLHTTLASCLSVGW
jgi:hypothetical protein